jgi:hypothetical protein
MLEWIVFGVLAVVGLWFAHLHAAAEHVGADTWLHLQGVSHGMFALALASSADVLVAPAYARLRALLPMAGAHINQAMAVTLVGLACVTFIVALPRCVGFIESALRGQSSASKIATNAIERARRSDET